MARFEDEKWMRREEKDYRYNRDRVVGSMFANVNPHGENIDLGPHYGKGPKGWKRSDERIKENVCEALYRYPHVDASDIEVTVKDACVYLRGTVESREVKKTTENCVEHLSGVEDVQNELKIKRENEKSTGINQ